MKKLSIIKAVYFDPNIGPDKGTDVTRELSAQIKADGTLFYSGKYNDIFPDEFKRAKKKLFVTFEYDGVKYEHLYQEDEKIYLPFDKGISVSYDRSIVGDYIQGDKITQSGYKPILKKTTPMSSQGFLKQITIGIIVAIVSDSFFGILGGSNYKFF